MLSGPGGDAIGQSFMPGFVYVSYIDRVDTGHGIYYMLNQVAGFPAKARGSVNTRFPGDWSSFNTRRMRLHGRFPFISIASRFIQCPSLQCSSNRSNSLPLR
jgi:hypothetical protein